MNKSVQNKAKKPKRLTKLQTKALALVKADPLASNYEIGSKLKTLGVSENQRSVYSTLKHSEYINGEITQIRTNHLERMSRLIVPKALKIHEKALTDKTIPIQDKREWVKMAEAVEFKIDDSKRPSVPQVVNYTEIQAIIHQTIMRDDVVQTKPKEG